MPGINAIFKKSGTAPASAALCSSIREKMLHFPFYVSQQIVADTGANIGFTGYREYPFKVIDHPNFTLILEGRIYNRTAASLDKDLRAVAEAQVHSSDACAGAVKALLLNAEGEFVLTIYDKVQQRITVANDTLGRLPLYYFQDADSLIFARELKFILPFLPRIKFSKDAILDYLLFGFPFGERTFVETVGFFPAATCLSFDLSTGKSTRERYHTLNINACPKTGSRTFMAAQMCQLFMDAVSSRASWVDKDKTIVSLSGGLDSRGTLAGLQRLGLRPTAVTAQSQEEHSAREVASAMGAEVYAIAQGHVDDERSFSDMVFLKDGLDCHPNLGQLYQNLQDLRDRFGGDTTYFTGIYGGEITRHSHPTGGLSSLDSLARYLLSANDSYKYSTSKVAAILDMTQSRILGHLLIHLREYPETRIHRKYARFRHEYDMRFAGEAEDRNRFYFWTISPYFAMPFFTYAMSIDEAKKSTWLFRDFLHAIHPSTCKAWYFNYRMPLNNTVVLWALSIAEGVVRHVAVKNALKRIKRVLKAVRRVVRRPAAAETRAVEGIRAEVLALLRTSSAVKAMFPSTGLSSLIAKEDDVKGLDRLHIVFAYVDQAVRWHAALAVPASAVPRAGAGASTGPTRPLIAA